MPPRSDLISELLGTVGRFRRQVRRTAGLDSSGLDRIDRGTGLTESQSELLRLVGRRPGISVSQAAAELGLAANTASTLVSKLCAGGFLTRDVDEQDRRVGRLRLTEPTQSVVDESRTARRAALSEALDLLEPSEIDDLTAGLAVLTKITRLLYERQT
ncbi:MarR family transcriptional regulator [soil metagenome]